MINNEGEKPENFYGTFNEIKEKHLIEKIKRKCWMTDKILQLIKERIISKTDKAVRNNIQRQII